MIKLTQHTFKSCINATHLLSSIIALSVLSACGGGAGDDDVITPIDNGASFVEPFEGTWELPGNWSGQADDEAILLIKSPDNDGEAETTIYDFDDASTGLGLNCYRVVSLTGITSKSPINDLIFLDISAFPDALLTINDADNLVIEFSATTSTATDRNTTTIVAERIGLTETDITPLCDS